ncbi:unnamed protein product [Brassica oleracea]|uniref:Uncharacterized protein n=1 Tax=Brassica oleracea var. oleracea TaxID=109376 RepID=A0A0D3AAA3_BRAOL
MMSPVVVRRISPPLAALQSKWQDGPVVATTIRVRFSPHAETTLPLLDTKAGSVNQKSKFQVEEKTSFRCSCWVKFF